MIRDLSLIAGAEPGAYLLPATVRASPSDTVDKSNFTDETPKRIQTTITWGMKANLTVHASVTASMLEVGSQTNLS